MMLAVAGADEQDVAAPDPDARVALARLQVFWIDFFAVLEPFPTQRPGDIEQDATADDAGLGQVERCIARRRRGR